jgi:TetR/AcrR family transcriptional regulator, tetracycline repressor protein
MAVPAGGGEGRDNVSPPRRRPPADGGRPTRPALSREYILRATLALIDTDGVEAFSMRRLGAHLGVDPMSIYHYLPNKGALFDGVVELIWTEVSLDALGEHQPWPEQAAAVMRRFRAALRAHPKAVPIVGTRPAVTPAMLDLLERALHMLTSAGLPDAAAIDLMNCLAAFTIGHVLAEVGEPVGGDEIAPASVYTALSADSHPHLVAAFTGGYGYDPDGQFEHGLTALINGWTTSRQPGR